MVVVVQTLVRVLRNYESTFEATNNVNNIPVREKIKHDELINLSY